MSFRRRPVFMIGIAAELIGVHPQTLRMYEQKGLLRPRKSIKNTRLYCQEDIELGQHIQRLTQEMGLNLAGVRRILELENKIGELEDENLALQRRLDLQNLEHNRIVAEVHRSYKREIVPVPSGEITHRNPKER